MTDRKLSSLEKIELQVKQYQEELEQLMNDSKICKTHGEAALVREGYVRMVKLSLFIDNLRLEQLP
jgi:hypothetical protein